MSNYRGSIVSLLFKVMDKYKTMTVGEILYSAALKKNYLTQTDEEIYTSLEKMLNSDVLEDEYCTDQEFEEWSNNEHKSKKEYKYLTF